MSAWLLKPRESIGGVHLIIEDTWHRFASAAWIILAGPCGNTGNTPYDKMKSDKLAGPPKTAELQLCYDFIAAYQYDSMENANRIRRAPRWSRWFTSPSQLPLFGALRGIWGVSSRIGNFELLTKIYSNCCAAMT